MAKTVSFDIRNASEADAIDSFNDLFPLEKPWTLAKIGAYYRTDLKSKIKVNKFKTKVAALQAAEVEEDI